MKRVRFVGSARDDLAAFPATVRARAGHELFMVEVGRNPDDWKPNRLARELAAGVKRG